MRAYNGLNSIKVNIIEAGICPVCGRLLSIEKCDHPTTLEIEQWRAAVFAAEQELHSELWQRERLTDSAQRDADLLAQEIEKYGWQAEAEAEHQEWLDEQATRESVRP